MENGYWIGRKRSAMDMARTAATAEARLIHYDLAGRYSIKAAEYPRRLVPAGLGNTGSERPVLHLSRPQPSPAPVPPFPRGEGS